VKAIKVMTENTTRNFRPSLFSTILITIIVLVCLALANWQNSRILEKRDLQNKYENMLKGEALNLNQIKDHEFQLLINKEWQKVVVNGEFLPEYQLLLDSQVYQGKPGYNAIIPLKIDDSDFVILVNRGWIPAGTDRKVIPVVPALTEQQPIQGYLAKPKALMPGFEEQDIEKTVQLFINIAALSDRIAAPLVPMRMQLDERTLGPLPRERPKYQAKNEMHEFYIMNWLIVGFFSILIYIYFGFKANKKPSTL